MEQILEYTALAAELRSQLRPGVITNCTLRREDYEREIAAGSLYALRSPGVLLLLRQRSGFQRLNFYLQRDAVLPDWQPEQTTVLEIATRPRDAALRRSIVLWEQLGFSRCFQRIRMSVAPTEPPSPIGAASMEPSSSVGTAPMEPSFSAGTAPTAPPIVPVTPEQLDWAMSLLNRCFDARTACLPTPAALLEAISSGGVLSCGEALVHFTGQEIRHLCVDPRQRGQGLAQTLVSAALSHMTKAHVWVRSDFPHAIHIYEKNGFQADPWTSQVLIFR